MDIKTQIGYWIHDGHHIECSKCHESICDTDREGYMFPKNFCMNCGIQMFDKRDDSKIYVDKMPSTPSECPHGQTIDSSNLIGCNIDNLWCYDTKHCPFFKERKIEK